MKRILTLGALALLNGLVMAGPVPGVWNTDFQSSLDYAQEYGIPIAVVWGNTSCDFCNALSAVQTDSRVADAVARHPIMLVMKHEAYGSQNADYLAAKAWIESRQSGNLNGFPYVGFGWTAKGVTMVSQKCTGRAGKMPCTIPSGDAVGQFANSIELLFGSYTGVPFFACDDDVLSRLEAAPSTSEMYVPLLSSSASSTLRVTSPSGAVTSYPVAAQTTEVRIDVPSGVTGQKTTLELVDAGGTVVDTTHVTYVAERDCSIAYPKWIGESFGYGEWTMDYAAAKAKGGYVLAMFTGTLWCPFCYGCENSLLADPKFTQWAKDNSVALVSFDQGNSSTPATAAGNGRARLLSFEAGESHIVTGLEPSGAFYLSTKGIPHSAAQNRIDLTTKYTSEWLAPGSTSARLGNPTFLLLKDDKVVGRLAAYRDDNKVYDIDENLARLDDLLYLAARDDESSDYIQTTEDLLAAGGTVDVSFQINSKTKCFRLSGEKTCYIGFSLTNATAATEVKLEVVTATKTLASGTGSVIARVSAAQFAAGVWLKATAVYPSGKLGGSSVFTAQIASAFEESGSGGDEDGPGFDPEDKPCLGWEEYDLGLYSGFSAANSFNLANVEGAKSVSIKKVSGTLPSGVTLRYDKSSGRVVLSGSPKKPGTYEVSYTVTAKFGVKSVTGIPSTFVFTVADPKELNPFLGRAYSNITVPLYAGRRLAGVLTVSITKANKVTAKYAGTESKTAKFSGAWTALDDQTHDAKLSATVKNGPSLELSLSPDGMLSAELSDLVGYSYFAEDDVDFFVGAISLPGESAGGFAGYVGNYTVTLPDADEDDPAGTGFLTLKMAKSAVKTGKVTWSGVLPDGTKISGTSTLAAEDTLSSEDGEYASLVIFQRKGKFVFGAELLIRAGGAFTWNDDEGGNEIIVAKSAPAYVLHREKNLTYERTLDIYGGYLPDNATPADICDALELDCGLEMTLGGWHLAPVVATAKGFSFTKDALTSLSYAKKTGIFSGKAKVMIDGKAVTGTIKGVLLVNWISCGCSEESIDRPYGSGTFYAKGISLPVDLLARSDD